MGGESSSCTSGGMFSTAQLHWKHSSTFGVRQTDTGTEIARTPMPEAAGTEVIRNTGLTLDANGQVHGSVQITMTGGEALLWRQQALTADAEQAAKEFRDQLQSTVPPGVQLQMEGFTGLTDFTVPLAANLQASGALGTRTGRRLFIPGAFFEAQANARFANAARQTPVFLPWAYTLQDHVELHLPPDVEIEERPNSAEIPFTPYGSFKATSGGGPHDYVSTRQERVAAIQYSVQQYPDLRSFFEKMNAQDQAQLVLQTAPATASRTR
jgi:hypothetical protein